MTDTAMTVLIIASALVVSLAAGAAFAWFGLKGLVRIFFVAVK